MTYRRLLLLLILCAACKPATKPAAKTTAAAGPQVRATIVTIRTTTEPAKKTTNHTIVIANDVARSTDELDVWRLFDVKKGTVTFVDDIDKTFRVERFPRPRQPAPPPPHTPRVTWSGTGQRRAILGVTADQSLITAGAYRRELWIGDHSAIPEQLFAMLQLSDPPSSPLAPMMRGVEDAILAVHGFPLLDHAELPSGNTKLVVERAVVDIAQKDVPKAMLEVPRDYRDVTPKPKAPAANRRRAS